MFILYKRNIFNLAKKPIFWSIGVVAFTLAYMEAGEYFLNNYMWDHVKENVKDFGIRKQQEMAARYRSAGPINRLAITTQDSTMEDELFPTPIASKP